MHLRTVRLRRRITVIIAALALTLGGASALAADPLTVFGTDGNDTLNGTAADEAFYARGGDDKVNGGGGDDELDGGPGADVLSGGDGRDVVSYAGTAAVTVTLDGTADDGAAGEGDNVLADVEDVISGDGADKLTGSAAGNTLDGSGGDDRIDGGAGVDSLFGGAGDDTIDARDGGPDYIDCGEGTDTAVIDRVDVVIGCEKVSRPPVTAAFSLNFKPVRSAGGVRVQTITLVGVLRGSSVVVACAGRCGGGGPLVKRDSVSVKNGQVTLKLPVSPKVPGGATLEVGVAAPEASRRCFAFRLGEGLRSLKRLSRACTTVARPQ